MIGIGMNDEQDITVKGLDRVNNSDFVFLEGYTSKLDVPISKLEEFYGKKIVVCKRAFVEDGKEIISKAKSGNVAVLVIGDVFSATTHISLFREAKESNVSVEVVNNASVLNAVGITGLELYKFGKVASIPFIDSNVPYEVFLMNEKMGLHSLFLLDLKPFEDKFMECKQAVAYLVSKGFDSSRKVVVCAKLGSKDYVVKYLKASEVVDLGIYPQCLIVPGKMHFMEEEMLESYK
jgi:diphthine synthase